MTKKNTISITIILALSLLCLGLNISFAQTQSQTILLKEGFNFVGIQQISIKQ